GKAVTGWHQIGEDLYYFDQTGAAKKGLHQEGENLYYFGDNGVAVKGFYQVGENHYYFDGNGIAVTGWQQIGSHYYYFDENHAMVIGWLLENGKWYFFNTNGEMATGWVTDKGKTYYLIGSGAMHTGWLFRDGYWYYFASSGAMLTGWYEEEGKKYYLHSDGKMAIGEVEIDGVTYYFLSSGALVSGPVITYTNYNYTIEEILDIQFGLNPPPQTDKYWKDKSYVHGDYLQFDEENSNLAIVTTTKLNVREGPSTDYRKVGSFKYNDQVKVLAKSGDWYEVAYGPWKDATRDDARYYVDPANFKKDHFQFLQLSKSAGISAETIDSKILSDKGILKGMGKYFVQAGKDYQINEIYLLAHAIHETGNGTSQLAKGVLVTEVDGNPVEPKTVYNMFGWKAYDWCALKCGSEAAYKLGWFSPEEAILGGAKLIANDYVHHSTYKQDTLYKMRWNPAKPGNHQYASDMGWAVKQINNIQNLYNLLEKGTYTLFFDVPVYK
ncbi:glucosaminidase domain-containing protein, partial [Bacillus sp. JJ1566]|uniref:glucosaminidase domain-containing protein n=1 Tax=Bacillus sp. JJ1566 TaxID=3122961 RepID=UPI002FFF5951